MKFEVDLERKVFHFEMKMFFFWFGGRKRSFSFPFDHPFQKKREKLFSFQGAQNGTLGKLRAFQVNFGYIYSI